MDFGGTVPDTLEPVKGAKGAVRSESKDWQKDTSRVPFGNPARSHLRAFRA